MRPEMEKYRGLLDSQQNQPMTKEQSELFIRCTFAEMGSATLGDDNKKQWAEFLPKMEIAPLGPQILFSRLEAIAGIHNVQIHDVLSVELFIFLTCLYDSPGGAVMWAHAVWTRFCETGKRQTCASWAHIFPVGFPTREEEHRIWDAQKQAPREFEGRREGDNMIDQFYNWPSPKGATPAAEPVPA